MPELTASGPESDQRWQNPIPEAETVRLGRAPRTGWKVPWDLMISREHAELIWKNGQLTVQCLETARNPIVFKGAMVKQVVLRSGDSFQIGNTTFLVSDVEEPKEDARLLAEHAFGRDELKQIAFGDAAFQMEVISRLPQLIGASRTDEEFAVKLVALLLEALPRADAAAVVRFDNISSAEQGKPAMIRWDSRDENVGRFKPSRRLLHSALAQRKSMLHVSSPEGKPTEEFTMNEALDWAICTPMTGEACKGWCLYVTGGSSFSISGKDLKGDVRFVELLAQFIGSIRQVRQLEKTQAGMSQFFSPTVLESLTTDQAAILLAPKESDITVIFCDVRGFSKMTEKATDDLFFLLGRVSEALSVMTRGIVKYDGIIADFQGDAALGFWGWPVALDDGPLPACHAALAIHTGFSRAAADSTHQLVDFRVGIGISHGRAIAGRIGSDEQAKVGVFGPPVNLGSRLEGMTKQLKVPILIDEPTAEFVRTSMPPAEGRCRRLGRVRPYGIATPLTISELLPPADQCPAVSDRNIVDFEAAVDAFSLGDWPTAAELLKRIPDTDGPKEFLMTYMAQQGNQPPADWDGVIPMARK